MAESKENLLKLVDFIENLANQPYNEWFKKDLLRALSGGNTIRIEDHPKLTEIYEHCINGILVKHANEFYKDFALTNLIPSLEKDFIRMEQFRRSDSFEDFCIAAFQQLEAIVNFLADKSLQIIIEKRKKDLVDVKGTKGKNKGSNLTLLQLIFDEGQEQVDLINKLSQPIVQWSFLSKFKAVLFRYYFNDKVNSYVFRSNFFIGYYLYQMRNLNHRGGLPTEKQTEVINNIKSNPQRYFIRFLSFLEEFTEAIDKNLQQGKTEVKARPVITGPT